MIGADYFIIVTVVGNNPPVKMVKVAVSITGMILGGMLCSQPDPEELRIYGNITKEESVNNDDEK